jgi:GNAT superfamily N-acetyltransferase
MIHTIDEKNIELLNNFMMNDMPASFRYFNSRDIHCIKNHIITLIMTFDDVPIGYGHLDKDGDNIWLGVCILEEHQGNKYGDKILDFLMSYVKENFLQNVRLAVDVDNYRAINLYMKKNFKIMKFCDTHYILEPRNTGNTLSLPVSLGEALDKLTILEIKLDKIKDDRKSDVQKEYDMLHKKLAEYINKNKFHYHTLKRINLSIWELQDKFRYGNSKDKDKICMKIIDENDRRFRVKNKINVSADSELKEQKGYKPKTAFVLTHLGLGDNITSIGAVRYLSTCYDKVIVVCKETKKTWNYFMPMMNL